MTAMLPPTSPLSSPSPAARTLGQFVWPAAATLALHTTIIALLVGNWSPEAPAASSEKVLKAQLVTIDTTPTVEPSPTPPPLPAAPEPEPIPEPIAAPPEPPPPVPTPEPAKPVKPEFDHAAIARERVREEEKRQQARRDEERRQEQARLAEQQRLEDEREQQRRQALAVEQARQAAEAEAEAQQQRLADARRKAEAEAASLSQYKPISKQPPAYPKRALDRRQEGDCTVEYTVTAKGKVQNPEIVDGGCDDRVFARAALMSAKSFRYQPRMVDGQPVAVPGVRNTFRFRLEQ